MERNFWVVRMGREEAYVEAGLQQGFVGVVWLRDKDLTPFLKLGEREFREKFSAALRAEDAERSKLAISQNTGNLYTFCCLMQVNDIVIVPETSKQCFHVGTIVSGYQYVPKANDSCDYTHRREVRWIPTPFSREGISEPLRNSFGSIMTVFSVSKHAEELARLISTEAGTQSLESASGSASQFRLESQLEEFLVENWKKLPMSKQYELYTEPDSDGNPELRGQQFITPIGRIDLLGRGLKGKGWLVIELKRGQSSDAVVGQVLRYMTWVRENLAQSGDDVDGLIVVGEEDERIAYALRSVTGVKFMKYSVEFSLSELQ